MRAARLLECVFGLFFINEGKNGRTAKKRMVAPGKLFSGPFREIRPKTEKSRAFTLEEKLGLTMCKRQPSADGLGRRLHEAVSQNLKNELPFSLRRKKHQQKPRMESDKILD